MFSSLTRISHIEANDRTAASRAVDLAQIAREVVELFDAAAEDKGGHIDAVANGPALVTGDRDLLFDAVANLVDNAIKHGREAGRVSVEVRESNGGPVISVARSEEHTSELQSLRHLVCRLLLEKKRTERLRI